MSWDNTLAEVVPVVSTQNYTVAQEFVVEIVQVIFHRRAKS